MAIRESTATLRASGWSVSVVAHDDLLGFSEEWLEAERKVAMRNMRSAQEFVVSEVKKTLSRVYPLIRSGSLRGRPSTDPSIISLRRQRGRRDVRVPSRPGTPPGYIMGDLQRSWQVGTRRWNKERTILTGRYFSRHPGAGAHEWGTRGRPKGIWSRYGLPSRPYIRPTLVRVASRLGDILVGADRVERRAA